MPSYMRNYRTNNSNRITLEVGVKVLGKQPGGESWVVLFLLEWQIISTLKNDFQPRGSSHHIFVD